MHVEQQETPKFSNRNPSNDLVGVHYNAIFDDNVAYRRHLTQEHRRRECPLNVAPEDIYRCGHTFPRVRTNIEFSGVTFFVAYFLVSHFTTPVALFIWFDHVLLGLGLTEYIPVICGNFFCKNAVLVLAPKGA